MQSWFHDLSDYLQQIAGAGEEHGFLIHTEESDFIRFNNGRFRQCGSVEQRSGSLRLIEGGRQVTGNITFTGSMEQDRPRLRRIYDRLRLVLADLAQDRLLEPLPPAFRDEQRGAPSLPPTDEVISAIDEAAKGRDMVGHWLAGPVGTGYSSSTGVRRWFENETFQLDWSYVISGDLAVKNLWAGDNWQRSELRRRIEEADRQLELMAQPRVDLPRGEYRAYLAPEALSQIILLLGWSGAFSARALRQQLRDAPRRRSHVVADGRYRGTAREWPGTALQQPGFRPPGKPQASRFRFGRGAPDLTADGERILPRIEWRRALGDADLCRDGRR